MNQEMTYQTNPMAPWDPLDALLTRFAHFSRPAETDPYGILQQEVMK